MIVELRGSGESPRPRIRFPEVGEKSFVLAWSPVEKMRAHAVRRSCAMKAVVLFESLTGNTRKAGELIATKLQAKVLGSPTSVRCATPTTRAIQGADLVIVGTWVHGLFVVGQAPWGLGALAQLPAIGNKLVATYCTFALNPAKSLDKMTAALEARGGQVIGGLALNRSKLDEHTDTFVGRLLANVPA